MSPPTQRILASVVNVFACLSKMHVKVPVCFNFFNFHPVCTKYPINIEHFSECVNYYNISEFTTFSSWFHGYCCVLSARGAGSNVKWWEQPFQKGTCFPIFIFLCSNICLKFTVWIVDYLWAIMGRQTSTLIWTNNQINNLYVVLLRVVIIKTRAPDPLCVP
jgi:hypothetical protein